VTSSAACISKYTFLAVFPPIPTIRDLARSCAVVIAQVTSGAFRAVGRCIYLAFAVRPQTRGMPLFVSPNTVWIGNTEKRKREGRRLLHLGAEGQRRAVPCGGRESVGRAYWSARFLTYVYAHFCGSNVYYLMMNTFFFSARE
jgi:hypothetical protein